MRCIISGVYWLEIMLLVITFTNDIGQNTLEKLFIFWSRHDDVALCVGGHVISEESNFGGVKIPSVAQRAFAARCFAE